MDGWTDMGPKKQQQKQEIEVYRKNFFKKAFVCGVGVGLCVGQRLLSEIIPVHLIGLGLNSGCQT